MALPNLSTGGLCDILSAQIVHNHSIVFFPLGRKTVLENNKNINLVLPGLFAYYLESKEH